nr:MAG TPA: hypothetical protein [Caudoviricetes sp.]
MVVFVGVFIVEVLRCWGDSREKVRLCIKRLLGNIIELCARYEPYNYSKRDT